MKTTKIYIILLMMINMANASFAQSGFQSGDLVSPLQPDQHYFRQDVIYVKFQDNQNIRLVNAALTDFESGQLDPVLNIVNKGHWEHVHSVPVNQLLEMQAAAAGNLDRPVPDLSMEFYCYPSSGADIQQLLDRLNGVDIIDYALGVPLPVIAPLPPDFEADQGYLDPAGTGLNAEGVWSTYANRGAGVKVCDIEYTVNDNHDDLPNITIVGPTPQDPGFGNDHGTAVMGVIASMDNGWGTTGIASDCQLYFAGTFTNSTWNVGAAITNALTVLGNGDVILLEQQYVGPNGGSNYVPVEWYQPTYNAIVTAVGLGINVVEAAGNGGDNLDGPEFSTGNGGHYPFLAGNESGAIIVGSANVPAAFGGSDVARSRRGSSCYGSRLDLQAWGTRVYTTGYGNAYNSEGVNREYTAFFSGTSSASAIITGGVALFQAVYKAANNGAAMTPSQLKNFLITTGQPQTSGVYPASQHIGPFPDLLAASQAAIGVAACSEVTTLMESNLTSSSVRLSWAPVSNADHHEIRGNVVGNSGYVYLPISNGSPNFFDVANLIPDVSYFWEIIAFCNPDETLASNWSAASTFTTLPCQKPTFNFTTSVTATSASLNWPAVSGASGYRIRGRALGLGGSFITIDVTGGANNFFNVSGLTSSTTYEWQVAALCGSSVSAFTGLILFSTNSIANKTSRMAVTDQVNELRVFPNPASENVTITFSKQHGLPSNVAILDMNGKVISTYTVDQFKQAINIKATSMENGIYLINASRGNHLLQKRLVIAH